MNRYKPRYKIAFQAKSKIWPYINSRLRRFFNIRGKKLVRRGLFKRYVLVFNNMKWTIARRYIRPYSRRRKAVRRRFKDMFYKKQQLRAFYGKIKEKAFRKNFQKYLTSGVNRNRSFFTSLERRLDIFFFRMRLLPTIFACNQYILQHGILINKGICNSPNALLRVGDVVSLNLLHWKSFSSYLLLRLKYRLHGKRLNLRRKFLKLKKNTWRIRRMLKYRKWFFFLRQKRIFLDLLIFKWIKKFTQFYEIFSIMCNKIIQKIFIFQSWFDSNRSSPNPNYTKDEWKLKWTSFILNIYKSRKTFLLKFNQFLQLERQRRKLFYVLFEQRWKLFYSLKKFKKNNNNKVTKNISKKSYRNVSKLNFKKSKIQYNKNQLYFKRIKKLDLNFWNKKTKKNFFKLKKNIKIRKKKIKQKKNFFLFAKTKKLKNNQYMKLILQSLGMLFKSYFNWLKIKTQFKIEEMYSNFFFLYFLSFFSNKNFNFDKLLNLIEQREVLMEDKIIIWKNKLLMYYNLFFYRYIRERRLKVIYKYVSNKKKKIFKGNLLTYFLIRHKKRLNRIKRYPRLKKLHWAIPSYMHFDVLTLRAVLIYQPMPKQIYYPFKCNMGNIASFYKSLAL